jgi:hypothetical protein
MDLVWWLFPGNIPHLTKIPFLHFSPLNSKPTDRGQLHGIDLWLYQCGRSSLSLRVSDILSMWFSHCFLHRNT